MSVKLFALRSIYFCMDSYLLCFVSFVCCIYFAGFVASLGDLFELYPRSAEGLLQCGLKALVIAGWLTLLNLCI